MKTSNLITMTTAVPDVWPAGALGASTARLGPVIEGLIGLLLALALLLLLLRWAGRRQGPRG